MEKIKVYFDCDGVILDTVKLARIVARNLNYDYKSFNGMRKFFIAANWYRLIEVAGQIDHSIDKINNLLNTDIYDIEILTKLCGSFCEEKAKRKYFDENLPGINVITLTVEEEKNKVVNPIDAVLVDDDFNNIVKWRAAGGIGIYFCPDKCDLEHDIVDDISKIGSTKGMRYLQEKLGKTYSI